MAGSGRLVVAFQPHLYSRTQEFAEGFGAALGLADEVVVMDVYGAREDPVPGVTGALVADVVPLPPGRVLFEPSWSAAAPALAAAGPAGRPGADHGRRRRLDGRARGAGGAARRRPTRRTPRAPVNRTGTDDPRPHRPVAAPGGRAPSGGAGHPAGPRRAGCARAAGPARPVQVGAGGAGARRRRRGCCWPARCSACARCRSTASRRCPPTRCGRPPASTRARRCCGSTSTPPRPGSPGCPQVASVEVTRGWPHTVVVTVVERKPVAVVGPPGQRSLVDAEGVLFDTVTGAPPAGVVPLDVPDPGPGRPGHHGGPGGDRGAARRPARAGRVGARRRPPTTSR